jgi:hypothetical protein
MTLFLNFRVARVGGAVATTPATQKSESRFALSPMDKESFKRTLAGRDILFVTHGYNNNQSEGACALARLEVLLDLPSSAVFVGILWPGDSHAGFISYPVEKPTANYVGRHLAAFCNRELREAASFSFASHSLGARVVLETIRRLDQPTRSACLMAAAIENSCLEKEYADAFAKIEHTYVLASENDLILRLAFPLGNFVGHLLEPTSNPRSAALGFRGPLRAIGGVERPWQIENSGAYEHGNYLPSSDPDEDFPPVKPSRITKKYLDSVKCLKPSDFVRRAFNLERQSWPV